MSSKQVTQPRNFDSE